MSKDVIIAGAIAVGCIALIAVAFIAPKSKSTESEAPKTETTTTITDNSFAPGPGVDPNAPNGAPFGSPAFPPVSTTGPSVAPFTALPPVSTTGPGIANDPFGHPGSTALPGPAPVSAPAPATPSVEAKTHTVANGELLGDIALKYYGSSKQWKKIQEANPGLDPKNLKVGQKLVIPGVESKPADAPEAAVTAGAGERTYTVKSGDTLYTIAKKELGSATRWKEIEKLNGISSNELRVGRSIKLPVAATTAAPAVESPTAAGGKSHTVAKGETLGDISRKYYGTTKQWKKIVDANPGVSPENLKIGQKLTIPDAGADAAAPGAAAPTDAGSSAEYVIKTGDTLGSIATKELGSKHRWKELQEANPGLDPRNLRAGQKIKIPGKKADAAAPAPAPAPALPAAPASPFGAPTGLKPATPASPTALAPTTAQPSAFPADQGGFNSPYGNGSFGQPSQPFSQTGPGFGQTGAAPAEPFPGAQPSPFAPAPPIGGTEPALR